VESSGAGLTTWGIVFRLLAVLLLVFANAFFVAAEFGLVGARRSRIDAAAARGERSAKRLRVTIVLALFIALVATALLVGRAVIAPVLTTGTGGRGGARVGEIVYSMPDGSFCRRLSFDNDTAALIEGAVEQCPANLPRMRARGDRNFAWGAR